METALRRQMIKELKPPPPPTTNELKPEDFDTKSKIQAKVGTELMDMDKLASDVFGVIPSTSSEMLYRMQLQTNMRIYGVFTAIGFLLVVAVFLYVW